jgi:hypothetical protein
MSKKYYKHNIYAYTIVHLFIFCNLLKYLNIKYKNLSYFTNLINLINLNNKIKLIKDTIN